MTNVATLQTVADLSASITAQGVSSLVPAGVIMAFGGATAPTGWLLCEGAAVSRTTYAALFAAIGVAHGYGDNSTTFNLPDYRGRFIRGRANSSANDPDRASRTAAATGGNTGDAVGSIQTDQFRTHVHGAVTTTASLSGSLVSSINRDSGATNNSQSAYTGGNETRPLNAYVNYIIKI